jgi:uncharacterized protein YwqG
MQSCVRVTGPQGCLAALALLAGSVALILLRPVIGAPLTAVALLLCWRALQRANALEKAQRDAERARRASVGPPTADAWRRLLELEGLGDVIERIAPHVRPAVRLVTRQTDESLLGRSRVGGRPDLTADLAWPRHDNASLAFLAQVNLREVAAAAPDVPLPRNGYLWFFCDAAKWDFSSGGAVVLYRDDAARLQPVSAPDDLPRKFVFTNCAVTMEYYQDVPDHEDVDGLMPALGNDEGKLEAYLELREYLNDGTNDASPHKLLGYANAIQGRMEAECVPGAHDWRLLLQVDSDANAGMMWGDAGRVYFWIRDEDLRAARFDRTCAVLQCY